MYDGVIEKPSLNELYHHGITGMKWGVKNGPPYPLSSKISTGKSLKTKGSVSKKKVNSKNHVKKASANAKDKNGLLAELAVYFGVTFGLPLLMTSPFLITAAIADKYSLTPSQKTEYLKNKQKQKTLKELRKGTEKDKETGLKLKKNKNATMEEDMDAVNFYRGKRGKTNQTYQNCVYCTTAYDLRRRGFEVRANTARAGLYNNEVVALYKNAKESTFTIPKNYNSDKGSVTANVIKKELTKQPAGARGNLCVRWKFCGAHSVAYEIVKDKKGGKKVIILDCQANKKYEGKELDNFLSKTTLEREPIYFRTDNIQPDYDMLKKKGIVS